MKSVRQRRNAKGMEHRPVGARNIHVPLPGTSLQLIGVSAGISNADHVALDLMDQPLGPLIEVLRRPHDINSSFQR